jgi:hypothetical protein
MPVDRPARVDSTLKDAVARRPPPVGGHHIPNDGEFGKSTSWSLYALAAERLRASRSKGGNPFARGADRACSGVLRGLGRGDGGDWPNVTRQDAVCVGPPRWALRLQRDIDNLKAATKAAYVDRPFSGRCPISAIPTQNEHWNDEEPPSRWPKPCEPHPHVPVSRR